MFFRSFLAGVILGIIVLIAAHSINGKGINVKGVFIKNTPTPSPSLTPTITLTPTPTPTSTPTPSPSKTPTPTNTPSPTSIPLTSEQLEGWFEKYASEFSIDKGLLRSIAACESGFNPEARNKDYVGLFQFTTYSWQSTRNTMNSDPNPDLRINPEESIKTAAFKIADGGRNAWPNCGK